jgi:hypothetical protein
MYVEAELSGRAFLLVLLTLAALPASAHAADGDHLKVTVDQPSKLEEAGGDTYLVGTQQPTFHVQADQIPPGYEVQCQVDGPPPGPCGTQDPHCPVAQCWTYSPSFSSDGDHQLTVAITDPNASDDFDVGGVYLSIDTTPPDTKLDTVEGAIDFPDARHVAFAFARADDDSLDSTFQCAITSPSAQAPSSWSKCTSGQRQPQRLALTGTYRFWVRALDFLGRPDPTPATYVFSPTPCHLKVVGHPHRLRAIVQHGLKLRMTCVEPVGFEISLLLNSAQVNALQLPSALLGVVDAQTKTPQTSVTFTLHTFKGLPKKLFRQKKLFAALYTNVIGTPPKLVELKLHK